MCHKRVERQTDEQTNETDFTGPLSQRRRVDHALLGLILYHMDKNQSKKKEYNQHSSMMNTRKRNTVNIA